MTRRKAYFRLASKTSKNYSLLKTIRTALYDYVAITGDSDVEVEQKVRMLKSYLERDFFKIIHRIFGHLPSHSDGYIDVNLASRVSLLSLNPSDYYPKNYVEVISKLYDIKENLIYKGENYNKDWTSQDIHGIRVYYKLQIPHAKDASDLISEIVEMLMGAIRIRERMSYVEGVKKMKEVSAKLRANLHTDVADIMMHQRGEVEIEYDISFEDPLIETHKEDDRAHFLQYDFVDILSTSIEAINNEYAIKTGLSVGSNRVQIY